MLPSYIRVHSVTPGHRFLPASITAIILRVLHFREHHRGPVVRLGLLRVPSLACDTCFCCVHGTLVPSAAASYTIN